MSPELYQSFSRLLEQLQLERSATLTAMARQMSLPSDPQHLLQFMDDLDSDFSDDHFEGYIDEDEWLEEAMRRRIDVQQGDGDGRNSAASVSSCRDEGNGMANEMADVESDSDGDGMLWNDGLNSDGNAAGGEEDEGGRTGRDHTEDASTQNGLPAFAENVGVVPDMTGKEPVDYYRLFITDSLLQNVLDETNHYGEQYVDSHKDHLDTHPRARPHDFVKRKFTMSELLRLFVLIITMGIVDLPSLKDYWSTSWLFCTPHFSSLLSRDRFLLLLKFLHLVDNTKQVARDQPGYDKLFKLRLFMDPLIKSFQRMFVPQKQLSIDEAMISFKGRLSFLQFLPKKPKKWGMKAWALADSKMGYVCNWSLYCGKENEQGREPLGERVVTSLLTGLENKGYHVYFDNFYTSPSLCKRLLTLGFGSCGTVQLDRRNIPATFKQAAPKKGEIATYRDDKILGLKWKDKRYVSILSHMHGTEGYLCREASHKMP